MGSLSVAPHRYEIILIGPIGAGKSTLGRLLSQRLALPQVAVDAIRWGYSEQIGYDEDHVGVLSGRHGFEGVYRYWKRFELYAVERILAEHADCVVDFGGGHLALTQGALSAARARYAESFAIRRERGDPPARSEILEGLALLAAAEGEAATALTLAEAADALQKDGQSPTAPMHALRARYLDPARQSLPPDAQDRAVQTGRAMPVEEALAYAAAFVDRR